MRNGLKVVALWVVGVGVCLGAEPSTQRSRVTSVKVYTPSDHDSDIMVAAQSAGERVYNLVLARTGDKRLALDLRMVVEWEVEIGIDDEELRGVCRGGEPWRWVKGGGAATRRAMLPEAVRK